MHNKAPIFVNGFQRGGTNMLMNLIYSHPEVCMLGAETHDLFYGGKNQPLIAKWRRRISYLPIFFAARQHLFWPYRFQQRPRLPYPILNYIDWLFYHSKMSAPRNDLANENMPNTLASKAACRILCKNVNGVTLATHIFAEMYPDATFIGLVRNGFALCEGFMRRGWTAKRVGNMYEIVCQQMLRDAAEMHNYHIVYFEDLLADPVRFTKELYQHLDLSISDVSKFSFQAKRAMTKSGRRTYTVVNRHDREIMWFPLDELQNYYLPDVNANQIARLQQADKDTFLQYAGSSMMQLGYI